MNTYKKQLITAILLVVNMPVFAAINTSNDEESEVVAPATTATREALATTTKAKQNKAVDPSKFNIHGVAGLSWDSHLVSYGRDVWRGGDKLTGDQNGLLHPWVQVGMRSNQYQFFGGTWMDINDNSNSGVSGDIQEIDLWLGVNRKLGKFNFGLNLQRWNYGDEVEIVLDSSVTFNDAKVLFKSLALNPGLTLHSQLASDIFDEKNVLVARITLGFALIKQKDRPVWLSLPVALGFQQEGYKNNPSGHSYSSIGADLYIPLKTSSKHRGNWSMNIALSWFDTDPELIPENPEESFLTGKLGILHFF